MHLGSSAIVVLVNVSRTFMSRYHPVRPRKDKEHPASAEASDYAKAMSDESAGRQQVPQPAAPAQPSHADAEKLMHERLAHARAELYKLRNGDALDASIARWKRTLELYDRETAAALNEDPAKPHRWTVSPSMALRAEKHLQGLLAKQAELMDECHAKAHEIVTGLYARGAEDELLCPPKQTPASAKASAGGPAPQADFGAAETVPANASSERGVESPPIAG